MLIEQRRKNGEVVATIDCKEFLGNMKLNYSHYSTGFCIFDAMRDSEISEISEETIKSNIGLGGK